MDKHLIDEVEGVEKKAIMLPDILTAADVAKYLHIGRSNAYRLLSDGDILSFRVGQRSLRTTRDALQDYINQRCRQQH